MSHEWGRVVTAGRWQRAVPVWFMSGIVIAIVSGIAVWLVRQTLVWTPLQQFYLSAYARGAVASSLAIRTSRYRVLLMENRRGSRLAIDDEVVLISSPAGETNFALSELARLAGSGRLVWRDLVVDHACLRSDLQVWIYRGETLADLARPSLIAMFVVVIVGHRTNILNPDFTELGTGYATDRKGRPYYVQVFARPHSPVRSQPRRGSRPGRGYRSRMALTQSTTTATRVPSPE